MSEIGNSIFYIQFEMYERLKPQNWMGGTCEIALS